MKNIITTGILATIAMVLPATANEVAQPAKADACTVSSADANTALIQQVSDQISAKPETAGEVVKQAILQSKAGAELVLQIVKAAVLAAPEQAEVIRKVALALAPDAEKDIEVLIASLLEGDQVAAASDAANAARDQNKNASNEPEGREPAKNTVWLTNYGALFDGVTDANSLPSKVQDTAISPNVNHNQGAIVRGGTTVVIRPVRPPATTPTPP